MTARKNDPSSQTPSSQTPLSQALRDLAEADRQDGSPDQGRPVGFEELLALRDGRLDDEEAERVRARMVADPFLARRYLELEDAPDDLAETTAGPPVDAEKAWERFRARPDVAEIGSARTKPPPRQGVGEATAFPADRTAAESPAEAPAGIGKATLRGWQILAVAATLALAVVGLRLLDGGAPHFEELLPTTEVRRGELQVLEIPRDRKTLLLGLRPAPAVELGYALPETARSTLFVDDETKEEQSLPLQPNRLYLAELEVRPLDGRTVKILLTHLEYPDRVLGEYVFRVERTDASPR